MNDVINIVQDYHKGCYEIRQKLLQALDKLKDSKNTSCRYLVEQIGIWLSVIAEIEKQLIAIAVRTLHGGDGLISQIHVVILAGLIDKFEAKHREAMDASKKLDDDEILIIELSEELIKLNDDVITKLRNLPGSLISVDVEIKEGPNV